MRTILPVASCVLILLGFFAVRGLAQQTQPAHPPVVEAVAAEVVAAVGAPQTGPSDQVAEISVRYAKPPKREIFTCSNDYLDRCFDSRYNCYDCSRRGNRIEPPSNIKWLLLLQGEYSGMELYEPEGVQRETYKISSRARGRMGRAWDREGSNYVKIPEWRAVREGAIECIRTEPIGRTFGNCCGACSYTNSPSPSNPAGLCCQGCSYLST